MAARGVIFLRYPPRKEPENSTMPPKKAEAIPTFQASVESLVPESVSSMYFSTGYIHYIQAVM
jgi:hypothetical protein